MDKYHGKGCLTDGNGEKYDGEWRFGLREGQGKFYWRNGAWYEGGWKGDQREGEGTYHRKHYSRSVCLRPKLHTFGPQFLVKVKEMQMKRDNGLIVDQFQGKSIKALWN